MEQAGINLDLPLLTEEAAQLGYQRRFAFETLRWVLSRLFLHTGATHIAQITEQEVAEFSKTELELGHCLRLPQEGPCECDLYLSCAKFVTTPEYAPRLRRRRRRELELIEDARSRGWQREVERHQGTIRRLEQLLVELGEPLDEPEAAN